MAKKELQKEIREVERIVKNKKSELQQLQETITELNLELYNQQEKYMKVTTGFIILAGTIILIFQSMLLILYIIL